jgi:hypothetical protein
MTAASDPRWIRPDWPAPGVGALITTRSGGKSRGPYGAAPGLDGGLNIGLKSGDAIDAVLANRALLRAMLPGDPRWLRQVHGADVVSIDNDEALPPADAAVSLTPGYVCAVSIADCLPVLLAQRDGRAVGAAHAGWRGLAAGVIQNTATEIRARLGDRQAELIAFLGPAIGPARFEVGAEVLAAMSERLPHASDAFRPGAAGKFYGDLFALARQALAQAGIDRVYGGGQCTFSAPDRFYSFRRDRVTGRHAALIWIEP